MTNARIISNAEFLKLLSEVRLGVNLEVIKNIDLLEIDELFTKAQAANIMQNEGKELSAIERDVIRADIARKALMDRGI